VLSPIRCRRSPISPPSADAVRTPPAAAASNRRIASGRPTRYTRSPAPARTCTRAAGSAGRNPRPAGPRRRRCRRRRRCSRRVAPRPDPAATDAIVSSAFRSREANSRSACGSAGSVTIRYPPSSVRRSASDSSSATVTASAATPRSSPVATCFGSGSSRHSWTVSRRRWRCSADPQPPRSPPIPASVGPSPAAREPTAKYSRPSRRCRGRCRRSPRRTPFEPGDEPLAEVLHRELPREEEGRLGEFRLLLRRDGVVRVHVADLADRRERHRREPSHRAHDATQLAFELFGSGECEHIDCKSVANVSPDGRHHHCDAQRYHVEEHGLGRQKCRAVAGRNRSQRGRVLRYSATTATPSRPVTPSGISARKYQR